MDYKEKWLAQPKEDSLQNVYDGLGAEAKSKIDSFEMDESLDAKLRCMASADREDKWLWDQAMEAALTDVAEIVSTAAAQRKKLTRQDARGDNLLRVSSSPVDSAQAQGSAGARLGPPSVLILIHASTHEQIVANVRVAMEEGATGVVLCNYEYDYPQMLPLVRSVRGAFPQLFLGLKFPRLNGADAFPICGKLAREGTRVDAVLADSACINIQMEYQEKAEYIETARTNSGWGGVYYGGVASANPKGNPRLCQPVEARDLSRAASMGAKYVDVVCTDKVDEAELVEMRRGCGDTPLAVCGALTAGDAARLVHVCDCFIVECGTMGQEGVVDREAVQGFLAAVKAAHT